MVELSPMALIECIANVSEGRRPEVLDACADAIRAAGVRLLDVKPDAASRVEPGATAAIAEVVPGWSWPRRSRTAMGAVGVLVAALVLVIGVTSTDVQDWVGLRSDREQLLSPTAALKLPMLSSADVALIRAQTLYNRGRLAEALQALDRISPESPARSAADEMRVRIQQLLLASSRDLTQAGRVADPRRR